MKLTIFHILAFWVISFAAPLQGQTTAVMQVRVNVVSGAGCSSIEESIIDLSSADYLTNDVKTGAFSIITAPSADVNVQVSRKSSIKNADGQAIDFESISVNKISNEKGEHQISLTGKIAEGKALKGQYKGNLTATIEYL
jgi:hypothetical protein